MITPIKNDYTDKKIFMKKLLFACPIIFLLAFFLFKHYQNPPSGNSGGFGEPFENPAKRAEWEFKRLRDPETGKIPEHIREKELAFAATLPNDASFDFAKTATQATWTSRGPWNYGGRTRAF